MTSKANPTPNSNFRARETSAAIRYGGKDWVVPDTERKQEDTEGGINSGPLNAFNASHSASSFDVTIDTGEGFVDGAWVATDTTTTVTLASSTSNQSVYVGWDYASGDTVLVGTSSAFDSNDPKMEVWEFDTDGSGVTSATDRRDTDEPAAFGGDHSNLTNVTASQHHSKYTDSEAVSAVNNDANHSANATHDHADVSNILSDQHHSRYADSEARNAVTGTVDAADLSASGSNEAVLESDGSNAYWTTSGRPRVYVQSTAPSNPKDGDVWIDTN